MTLESEVTVEPGPQPPRPPQPPMRGWQGKHKRMAWLGLGALVVSAAAVLAITALEQNLTFFYSPADLADANLPVGRDFRLGGMVADNSIEREQGGLTVHFIVSDYSATTPVTYQGILPDLFREGQGVVAIGSLDQDGRFQAHEILAKHDENYMPPEVAAALERNRPKGQPQSMGTLDYGSSYGSSYGAGGQ